MIAPLLLGLLSALTPVHLDVERDDEAALCPDAPALAALVTARVGDGAIVEHAERRVRVVFTARPNGLSAELSLVDDDGERGRRTLGPVARCDDLTDSVTLALSLVVDPLLPLRAGPAPLTAATTPTAPSPVATTAAAPPSPASPATPSASVSSPPASPTEAPWRTDVEVLAGVASGALPGVGGVVDVGVRVAPWPWASLVADAVVLAPRTLVVDGAHRVESQGLLVGVDGCVGARVVAVCAGVAGGAVRALGLGYEAREPVVAPLLVPRAQLVGHAPLGAGIDVVAAAAAGAPVLRAALLDADDARVWETAPVTLDVRVGLSARLGG